MSKINEMYEANGIPTPQEPLTKLIENIDVPATPFTLVGNPENGYFITLGKYKLTEPQSLRQCQLLIEKRDYELLFAMIGVAIAERHNVEVFNNDMTNTKVIS